MVGEEEQVEEETVEEVIEETPVKEKTFQVVSVFDWEKVKVDLEENLSFVEDLLEKHFGNVDALKERLVDEDDDFSEEDYRETMTMKMAAFPILLEKVTERSFAVKNFHTAVKMEVPG